MNCIRLTGRAMCCIFWKWPRLLGVAKNGTLSRELQSLPFQYFNNKGIRNNLLENG